MHQLYTEMNSSPKSSMKLFPTYSKPASRVCLCIPSDRQAELSKKFQTFDPNSARRCIMPVSTHSKCLMYGKRIHANISQPYSIENLALQMVQVTVPQQERITASSSKSTVSDDSNAVADVLENTLWNRQLGTMSEEIVAALVCQIFEGIWPPSIHSFPRLSKRAYYLNSPFSTCVKCIQECAL